MSIVFSTNARLKAWLGSAVLALAGCSSDSSPSGLSGYNVVCNGKTVPKAAAYQGAGPHPIAFFLAGSSGGDGTLGGIDPEYVVPASWSPSDASLIQLVACINITDSSRTQDCGGYSVVPGAAAKTHVTLQWQTYTISLYQAKTGTLVTQPIVLVGDANATCPYTVHPASPSDTYAVYTTLAPTQVQEALNKYVT